MPEVTVRVFPEDEHNRTLVQQVHPPDWINPTPSGRYDMVVIGAGTAGLITAIGCAGFGKKVALIERHLMGGDCLNVGCVPSKALIRAGRAAADVRRAGEFGVHLPAGISVDFAAVMKRMRRLRADISHHDGARRYADLGVDVYLGEGRFTDRDTVSVDGQMLRFKKACIATGARAAAPPIEGLEDVGYLTNETIFELTEPPRRLAVIGAGPIGCELSQTFARFGSEVHLIDSQHGVLPREDPEAAEIIRRSLLAEGVRLYCCGRNLKVIRNDSAKTLSVHSHEQSFEIHADEILVSAGRKPNTEGLGLDAAGVRYDKKGVQTDDLLRTGNRNIFAAGDICSKYQFTHAADANARIVIRNALLGWLPFKPRASKLVMPWCTYTDPEIAHVGAYPKDLDEAGTVYRTVKVDLADIDRAKLEGATDGLLKVHVRPNGAILGATLVASHAGEMIGEITSAMVHGIKLQKLSSVIHPYPTQAEVIKRAGDQFFKTRMLELKKRFLG